jgi:hypothetical protein
VSYSVRPPSVWPCPVPFCAPIRVQAYLDSRPISYVNSIAYRRRKIRCRGSGCDPRPPSRAASGKTGRCPPCILHRRYSRGGPVPATETGRACREPCKARPLGGCQVSRRTRK